MINCWLSDSESPLVTEINLDAVEKNGNEFNENGLKQDGEWLQSPTPDSNGFMRYRVLESKAIITRWSIRKTEAERSRQLRQSSSTLKSGTFSVTASQ
jgi:hypothetical protein